MVNTSAPLSDIRLLIVEDEALIAIMVEEFAEDLGCRDFRTVVSVQQALEAIIAFRPQLGIVDCSLNHAGPDFEVADALDDADIPFIFSSGHQTNVLPVRHRGRDFLAKPFSIDLLREAIIRIREADAGSAERPDDDGPDKVQI